MKNLDALLGGNEPETIKEEEQIELKALNITEYAFQKAFAYAKLACKIARRSIECGGYLIAPKDANDRVATDSFLARDQNVDTGQFIISAENVIRAGREINEMGYKVLGWWHSHGYLEAFFSSTDNNGQRAILNEIAAFNYITSVKKTKIENLEVKVQDRTIILSDKVNPQRKYEIEINKDPEEINKDPERIKIAKLCLSQEKRVGFAYGLVVNAWKRGQHYSEIITREICSSCRDAYDKSIPVDVAVFNSGTVTLDEKALRQDIEERVKMRPKFYSFFDRRIGFRLSSDLDKQPALHTIEDKPISTEQNSVLPDYYKKWLDRIHGPQKWKK